jgi:membrane protein implicated in regulation of membrane protease activity
MLIMPIFMHRVFSYCPGKPRSPLMRLLFGLIGLLLLATLLAFGVFIGVAMLLFAAARRLLAARRPAPIKSQNDDVIDAEFHVVDKQQATIKAQ